jgi:hypothetical protein
MALDRSEWLVSRFRPLCYSGPRIRYPLGRSLSAFQRFVWALAAGQLRGLRQTSVQQMRMVRSTRKKSPLSWPSTLTFSLYSGCPACHLHRMRSLSTPAYPTPSKSRYWLKPSTLTQFSVPLDSHSSGQHPVILYTERYECAWQQTVRTSCCPAGKMIQTSVLI